MGDNSDNILARAGLFLSGQSSSVSVACSSPSVGSAENSASGSASPPVHFQLHCRKCGKAFDEMKRRNQHEKDCGGADCVICNKHFSSQRALKEHTNTAHSTNFRCAVCKKCFGGLSKLNRHMPLHDEKKRVQCETSGKVFKRKDNLTRHMKTHNWNLHVFLSLLLLCLLIL